MNNELTSLLVLFVIVALTLAGIHCGCSRYCCEAETRRKLLHLNAGLISLSFVWLFHSLWPVLLICGTTLLALVLIRYVPSLRAKFGHSLHDVQRRSLGELLFPVAVASVFWLSQGDRVTYVIPLLMLTTADGAAALVARRYGLSPYATIRGEKTWEGTTIFLFVAFLSTIIPLLLLSQVGRIEILLIGCLLGLIGCVIEATSWSGWDNFFIPVGSFFALQRFLQMTDWALVRELSIVLAMVAVATLLTRRSRLGAQANLSAVLLGFILWSWGGTIWVAPALAAFVLHPFLTRLPRDEAHSVDLRSILSVASAAAVWLIPYKAGYLTLPDSLYPFCVALVAHSCMISFVRRREVSGVKVFWGTHLKWALVASLLIMGCYLISVPFTPQRLLLIAVACAIATGTSVLFGRLRLEQDPGRRWLCQATLAIGASALAGFLQYLHTAVFPPAFSSTLLACVLLPSSKAIIGAKLSRSARDVAGSSP